MKNFNKLFLLFLSITISTLSNAQISGTVFRDFNNNGTREAVAAYTEPMVPGIIVNVFNAADVLIASYKTTSGTGFPYLPPNYSIPVSGTPYNGTVGSNTGFVPGATNVRIEFTIPNSGAFLVNALSDFSAKSGGTSVQFVTGGATNINYGINNPIDFVFDATAVGGSPTYTFQNTFLFLPVQSTGNPLVAGTSSARNAFVKFPYNRSGSTALAAADILATNAQIGTTYGTAYSKQANRIFTTAYMKRHSGFGPAAAGGGNTAQINSPGAIYIINPTLTSTTGAASYFTSLDAIGYPTHNYAAGSPAWGNPTSFTLASTGAAGNARTETITYTAGGLGVIGSNTTRGLLGNTASATNDPAAYGQVGMVSLGDIEISDDGQYLFVSNFYDRKIYQLQLNNVTNPTSATYVTSWNLPNPPARNTVPGYTGTINGGSYSTSPAQFYDGTRGFQRPFGLKYYQGKLYIGAVTTGEFGGISVEDTNDATPEYTDLWAYVWELNPSSGFTATPSLQFPLNFNRGLDPNNLEETWKPWTRTMPASIGGNEWGFAQPMFAGIEFDVDGTLILGFRDRAGDQGGVSQFMLSTTTTARTLMSNGDQYRAYKNPTNGVFELEQNAKEGPSSPKPATAGTNSVADGANSTAGPTNYAGNHGEFYYQDDVKAFDASNWHLNTCQGSITMLKGTNQSTAVYMDPNALWSGGVSWMNNTTGTNPRDYQIQAGNGVGDIGKSCGLGDVEILTQDPPIEIGNRVWNDANGDGIQNPGEAGIGGVVLEIFVDNNNDGVPDGAAIGTTTTASAGDIGSWYFNNANITGDADPNTAGTQATLTQGVRYIVRPAAAAWTGGAGAGVLAGLGLTRANKIGNGQADFSDSDASLVGATPIPQISVLIAGAGQNNHNLDFGFKALASIGDRVWLDNGVGTGGTANDGIQNGTEPGVAGITVTLYQNGADGLPGTADDIILGTTVTDAYGNYLFDNLAASTSAATSYNVGFTLPANYQFTTQTNTQVTGTNNATNTTTTSGGSTAANGSDANATTGRTGSFWLAPGEAERGADAGLIFNTPIILNTIGDRVWFDNGLGGGTAGNGVQDGAEPGVAGVTVQLLNDVTGAVIATTVTDANGNYIFTGLPANTNYKVKVIPPAGTVFTTTSGTTPGNATTNSDVNATLTAANYGTTTTVNTGVAGTQITGIDAGLVSQAANSASLGDRVWNDLNSNGTQDAGEPGIAGVTVNLYEDANGDGVLTGGELVPVRTTVTDAFGNYIFNNLVVTATNRWQVEFVQPVGYNNTPVLNNNSGNDATDSDIIDNGTDRTGFIRLKFDERNTSVDAGFVQAAPAGTLKLGDKVWRDDDSDGIQDATEAGVPGVTVTLYQNGPDGLPGTADDIIIGTTSTDVNGNYLFVNLAASTGASSYYNVKYSNIPAGFSFTTQTNTQTAAGANGTPTGGSTVANGNDANGLGQTGSYNLTADNLDVDAGIKQGTASGKGSLGNKVWIDLPGGTSNVQDANEPGVAGVTVRLFRDVNGDGIISGAELTAVATTTTNALGEYIFDNLDAGTYQVGFSTLPAGYSLVTINAGTDDNLDSDGNALNTSVAGNTAAAGTSYTGLIALAQGEDNLSVDLGLTPPANTNTLGNFVWFDANSDGLQTAGEPGVAGVIVTLYNSGGTAIATTTTNANGEYLFAGLADGTYSVGFTNLPAGFDLTTKSVTNDLTGSDADRTSGRTGTVTLNFAGGGTNRDNRSLDAGIITTRAALGNKVWDDLNGDGIQDANEPGVPGVTVILYAADGTTVISSTITDQNGNYLFANLDAGTYVVGFSTLPAGKGFTQQNTAGDNQNNTNSDAAPSGVSLGKTSQIVLSAGEVDLTVDAGIRSTPVATVGNRVWDDLNGDGLQTAGEPGIAGVVATLYDNVTGLPVGSSVTDGNGNWLITNVPTGTYYVIFSNKPLGNFTIQDIGGAGTGGGTDSDTDSDVNASGQTGIFSVTPSTLNVKIDAGILVTRTLAVKVVSFTANKQNEQSLLNFVIANSAVGSVFSIERSVAGTGFTAIGTVNGTTATNYTYTDATPVQNVKNYYRIKEVDAQGVVTYSEIRILQYAKDIKISVYPIPAVSNLNISLTDALINKDIVISLTNVTGQTVLSKRIAKAGANETLDIDNLSNGTYQLNIRSNGIKISGTKVIVNR